MACSNLCICIAKLCNVLLDLGMMVAGLAVVIALLWIRFDENTLYQLRSLFKFIPQIPQEMFGLKMKMLYLGNIVFWILLVFGACVAVTAFIGICASLKRSRLVLKLYLMILFLFLVCGVAFLVLLVTGKKMSEDIADGYLTLAYQFNLQDTAIIGEKFNCCGDRTNNSYNNQCQGLSKPSCQDVLHAFIGIGTWFGGTSLGVLLAAQVASFVFSCILVFSNKKTS